MAAIYSRLIEIFDAGSEVAGTTSRIIAANYYDRMVFTHLGFFPQYWNGSGNAQPVVGLPTSERFKGVFSLAGYLIFYRDNYLRWNAAGNSTMWTPIANTISTYVWGFSNTWTMPATGVESSWINVDDVTTGSAIGQLVTIRDSAFISYFTISSLETNRLKLKPTGLSGQHPIGFTFVGPATQKIFTLLSNFAGDSINVGTLTNGEIYHLDQIGQLGYIFKRRSIQSIEPTGDSTVFNFIAQVTDEGFIGRYAYVKVGVDKIYFIGNRDVYAYKGGSDITPIANQSSKTLLDDLDTSRSDEIFGYHYEKSQEIWFVYPSLSSPGGPLKVWIYNYEQKSVTIDEYPTYITALTAAGRYDWGVDLAVGDLTGTIGGLSGSIRDLAGGAAGVVAILATKLETPQDPFTGAPAPTMLNYGNQLDRKYKAIESVWETPDFGDSFSVSQSSSTASAKYNDTSSFKYIDTVQVGIEVNKTPLPTSLTPYTLQLQLGGKFNMDSSIVWSAPQSIVVSGDGQRTTKVNLRATGRHFRLRLISNQAGCNFRITYFRLFGRAGGDY